MPLTKAYGTNSLWIESCPGKKDYSPVSLNYGDILQFDGANLYHGTEVNKTGQTRVSLDFRILPKKILLENQNKLSKKAIDILNNYYDEIMNCN
jgi:ectoine hydroxylase-related dioxygenase (phytanoyl-CoA dioxygenase family)